MLFRSEKCDGSGYPLQLKSSSIDPFAKMVAIADIYDATTSARIYRGPLCPFHAIELFQAEGYQKYDPHFILTFLENVVNSYIGSTAELSDKRIVEIILINKLDLAKPVVKCNNEFIDLSKLKGIYIKRILQSH